MSTNDQTTDPQVDAEAQAAVDAELTEAQPTKATEPEKDAVEQDSPEADDEGQKLGREAARYRVRLREAEAERDALAERLEAAHRREAESIAGGPQGRLGKPAALWVGGVSVADLLSDDGVVDPQKVAAEVERVASELGLPRTPQPMYVPNEGNNPALPALMPGDFIAGRRY
ncbi:hypothetical protein ACMYYO_13140 [Dermacoccaceae bacterium W4C1]